MCKTKPDNNQWCIRHRRRAEKRNAEGRKGQPECWLSRSDTRKQRTFPQVSTILFSPFPFCRHTHSAYNQADMSLPHCILRTRKECMPRLLARVRRRRLPREALDRALARQVPWVTGARGRQKAPESGCASTTPSAGLGCEYLDSAYQLHNAGMPGVQDTVLTESCSRDAGAAPASSHDVFATAPSL